MDGEDGGAQAGEAREADRERQPGVQRPAGIDTDETIERGALELVQGQLLDAADRILDQDHSGPIEADGPVLDLEAGAGVEADAEVQVVRLDVSVALQGVYLEEGVR